MGPGRDGGRGEVMSNGSVFLFFLRPAPNLFCSFLGPLHARSMLLSYNPKILNFLLLCIAFQSLPFFFTRPLPFSWLTILFHSPFSQLQSAFCIHHFIEKIFLTVLLIVTFLRGHHHRDSPPWLLPLEISLLSKESLFLWLVTSHSNFASHSLPISLIWSPHSEKV